jgi:hypothetical protein
LSWNVAPSKVPDLKGWLVHLPTTALREYCIICEYKQGRMSTIYGWFGSSPEQCIYNYTNHTNYYGYVYPIEFNLEILPVKKVF